MEMASKDTLANLGSLLASLMFIWAIFQQYFPHHLRRYMEKYSQRLLVFVYPYIQIKFYESTGDRFMRSEAYTSIENYLSSKSSTQAKRLKAEMFKNSQSLSLSMDDHEEVADEFNGVRIWWAFGKNISKTQTLSFYPVSDEKRYYKLTFHKKDRDLVIGTYLRYVMKEGRAIKVKNRQRKMHTNSGSKWSHVVFEHPATFDTIAMEPDMKQEIIDDLISFSKSEEFYSRIGRAWKRGYLLHGPPGTGKSTMIAAMANLLGYDVYDLELTAVKDNTELRRLLIEISSKSVIVIEDIDCSLELTGQRKMKKKKEASGVVDQVDQAESSTSSNHNPLKQNSADADDTNPSSKVTLSGLLNFIDGLWSACGGERLIVFTTNHLEKLDSALIRTGRMDKHIELSYCSYEAFKVLAKNYLEMESHELFGTVAELLGQVKKTPADVAEHLMPKTVFGDPVSRLKKLIQALEATKQEADDAEAGREKEGNLIT